MHRLRRLSQNGMGGEIEINPIRFILQAKDFEKIQTLATGKLQSNSEADKILSI